MEMIFNLKNNKKKKEKLLTEEKIWNSKNKRIDNKSIKSI